MKSLLYLLLFLVTFHSSIFAQDDNSGDLNISDEISFFTEEGDLDMSEYMSQAYGFLPVPIIITEPALGYGGGVTLVYLHDTLMGKKSSTGRRIPPSISGAVVFRTENGTQGFGAFHIGYWLEDTIRTATYIGQPNIFIDIYAGNKAVQLNVDGFLFYQAIKKRIGESNLFLGGSYMYVKSDINLDFNLLPLPISKKETIASVSLIAEYDTRDNQLTPTSGMFLSARAQFYDDAVGGDYNFVNYKSTNLFYNKLNDKINIDFSLVGEKVNGKRREIAPYLYPFVSMRGIPAMKYQGGSVVTAQTELSYNFTPRWEGTLFAGIGKAFSRQVAAANISFSDASNVAAGGFGFRYLIAEKFGLKAGIDFATSKDGQSFYIQIGTAWKGF
jgi:outer membrane protein assembly factor BamA